MSDIKMQMIVHLPELTLERFKAWNMGMNLLKSSLPDVREIGFNICRAISMQDKLNPLELKSRLTELESLLTNGNPK